MKRDRLWSRTQECTNPTAPESRDYCAKIDKMRSTLATARPAKEIAADLAKARSDLQKLETQLAGFNMADVFKKADPATDALAKFVNLDPETIKSRLAFMIALLFEMGGSLTVWIVLGSHAPKKSTPEPRIEPAAAIAPTPAPTKQPEPKAAASASAIEPEAVPLVLPEVDGPVATWCDGFSNSVLQRCKYAGFCTVHIKLGGDQPPSSGPDGMLV